MITVDKALEFLLLLAKVYLAGVLVAVVGGSLIAWFVVRRSKEQ